MKKFNTIFVAVMLAIVAGCNGDSKDTAEKEETAGRSGKLQETKDKPQPPQIDIWKAAGEGNIDAVKQHIAAGTDIIATIILEGVPGSGGSPLHLAVVAGQRGTASLLIQAGANLNQKASDASRGTRSVRRTVRSFGFRRSPPVTCGITPCRRTTARRNATRIFRLAGELLVFGIDGL